MAATTMTIRDRAFAVSLLVVALALGAADRGRAQTNYLIETPGGQFNFDVTGPGLPDNPPLQCPTIDLRAGNTYTFTINTASFHPVDITFATSPYPWIDLAYDGAGPQQVNSDVITLTIPATNYPSILFYICDFHGFFGQLNVFPPIVEEPPPPQNTITSLLLAPTNVTVKSTGTNTTYVLVPQFSSNLISGPWLDVPVFNNNFSNGTNTTSFGRLEPVCGPNVFIRISQRPPQ